MTARTILTRKSICLALGLAVLLPGLLPGVFSVLPGGTAGRAQGLKVGLITDSPTLMDGSFNQMAYAGLLRAVDDFEVEEKVYLPAGGATIEDNLAQCSADGNALCFMVGYLGMDAIYQQALDNPDTLYSILDISYDAYPPNLQGVVFASEQAAYMAGVLAGEMTQSDTIGMIGGMDIPPVNVFLCGFAQGATDSNPDITVLSTYLDNFVDPDIGAAAAQEMLDQGADVVFPAAGGAGRGSLLTATQAGAWAVGVDSDQYLSVFADGAVPGADHMLTSAMKRLDNAVYLSISETISGGFVSGTVVYDLAVDGVGLAPYHEAEGAIPPQAKAAVEAARAGLLEGTIDPLLNCRMVDLYLPFVDKGVEE
jgi:basic membrane protein A and related proteins